MPPARLLAVLLAALLHPLLPGGQAPLAAQEAEVDARERTVSATATASVEVAPDRAVLGLAVETFADSAAAAAAANAERMSTLLEALEGAGVPRERMETTGYRLHPEYARPDPRAEGEPRLRGYRATNELRVRVDSIPRVGALIDRAVGAGANRVSRLAFEVSDPEPARREAIRKAVERARSRAEAAAFAAGVSLGEVVEISLGGGGAPPVPAYAVEMARAGATTPVEPGTLSLSETVTVVWRLDGSLRPGPRAGRA